MSTLLEVQSAIADYQAIDAPLVAQSLVVEEKRVALEAAVTAKQAAADAADVVIAAAQADFDAAFAAVNALVSDQNTALITVFSTLAEFVPE
jgi:hypothetical protein